jgi:hypothetical protein
MKTLIIQFPPTFCSPIVVQTFSLAPLLKHSQSVCFHLHGKQSYAAIQNHRQNYMCVCVLHINLYFSRQQAEDKVVNTMVARIPRTKSDFSVFSNEIVVI